MYLRRLLQVGECSVTGVASGTGGPGVKQRGDVVQEVGLPRPEGELGGVVGVHVVVVGHGQGHPDIASGGLGLGRVALIVITLDPVTSPARLTAALVVLSVPELDIEHALGLLVALVDVETVPGHGVAVVRVTGLPAPGALVAVRARAPLWTTLRAPRRAPRAVCARCVPVAGVAGGGQGPVVGGDPQAPGHPPLRLAGAPLLHRGPALDTIILTTGAV